MGRLMALLGERLEPSGAVGERLFNWAGDVSPSGESVPLRLAGALHALKLQGKGLRDVYPPNAVSDDVLWRAVSAALVDHQVQILEWLNSAPQTNEVQRSAVILPALAILQARFGLPVSLLELGCSAGLNLRADRYCLKAGGVEIGANAAAVRLSPEWTGAAPMLELPEIVARAGVDLNPLDPENEQDRLRLLAYLWPDQPERIARTEAAIEEAARAPAEVSKGDAGAWLALKLPKRPKGQTTLIFHTVAWQYFPSDTVAQAEEAIALASRRTDEIGPLAHLSMEADGGKGAALTLTTWPRGDAEFLGRADFHGRWIDWQAG